MLKISQKLRLQLWQVMAITVAWVIVGALLAFYKSVDYSEATDTFIFQAPRHISLLKFVLINMIGPLVGGILGGSIIVFISKDRLSSRSYGQFILITCLMFLFIIFIINTTVSYIFYYQKSFSEFHTSFIVESVKLFVTDPYAVRNLATWLAITVITLFVLQVSDKYGPRNLTRFILGKYYKPREELRIFMMLDLNNSTALAEQLGHVKFFSLVKHFYADITDSITNARGEIYQYVGDEVVVTWTVRNGLRNINCVKCFFDIEQVIRSKSHFYLARYGCIPEFKAGLHIGTATVGEIGVIKKDIAYLGDVLNATARILGLCHTYHEKLLISTDLHEMLHLDHSIFSFKEIGTVQLRGKKHPLALMGVRIEKMVEM